MYLSKIFIIFIILTGISTLTNAQRVGSADVNWKIIKTENFDVIFSAEHQDLGLYYAQVAERAMAELSTIFSYKPKRTVLVVNDTTDISNGFATRIPYPYIMAFSVPVADHDTLSEAGDWAHELVVHELTHILQMEPALGAYEYIRPVFGTIVAPNMLLPLWWKEGMAVEMETQFSNQGRTRSAYQDAVLRSFVLDKKLFQYSISEANEVLPTFPYGARPYLFGSIFWNSLINDSGLKAIDHLTLRHAHRFPYFISQPMFELVKRDYESQYLKALNQIQVHSQKQISELEKTPFSKLIALESSSYSAQQPRWSNHLKMLATIESTGEDREIKFYDTYLKPLEMKKSPVGNIGHIDFHPTQKKLFFTKIRLVDPQHMYSDIFEYDIENGKTKPITERERAREISVSPDGEKIVYISTVSGKTILKYINLSTKVISTLNSSSLQQRLSNPLFWSSNEVLFTIRNAAGEQTLWRQELDSKKTKQPTNLKFSQIKFLRLSQYNGQKTLNFVSNESGVQNVYSTIDLINAKPLTHVPIGVWSYDIDEENKSLFLTHLTSDGFKISSTKLSSNFNNLPKIKNEVALKYQSHNIPKTPSASYYEKSINDYESGDYLWPQYWIPFLSTSSSTSGVFLQAQTSGHDPINKHVYSVLANYDTSLQRGGFLGFYTNSSLTWPIQWTGSISSQSFGDVTEIVETKKTALGINPDLFFISQNLLMQVGAEYQETNYFSSNTKHWGPYINFQYINYSQSIFDISPDNGWGASLKYENKININNSRDYNKVTSSLVGYFSPWLPDHHVIMTRVSSLLTFETVSARFGTSNTSLIIQPDSILPQFVLRGYQPSQFFGRSMWNFNFEYRFPISEINYGRGTKPYFLKSLTGAFVSDGLGVEGTSIADDKTFYRRTINESFWSSGAEIKLETTLGYILPINLVFGMYYPYSPLYASSIQTGISLQIGGF